MRKRNKLAVIGTIMLILGALSVTAFAATYSTPAEVLAGLTGKTAESVIEERSETGKTFGAIAQEAGKLEEFKAQMLESKKAYLDEKVAEGRITRQRADEIIAAMAERQTVCDGSASGRGGLGMGAGFGRGAMNGGGLGGMQRGSGFGRGACRGGAN